LRQYNESDIQRIKELLNSTFEHVTQMWHKDHSESTQDTDLMHAESDQVRKFYTFISSHNLISFLYQNIADGWLSDDEIGFDPTPVYKDTLQDYLNAPLVPVETLRRGGLLAYWDGQLKYTPRVAKFALSILSSPGKHASSFSVLEQMGSYLTCILFSLVRRCRASIFGGPSNNHREPKRCGLSAPGVQT
jgi:hypothetical protein